MASGINCHPTCYLPFSVRLVASGDCGLGRYSGYSAPRTLLLGLWPEDSTPRILLRGLYHGGVLRTPCFERKRSAECQSSSAVAPPNVKIQILFSTNVSSSTEKALNRSKLAVLPPINFYTNVFACHVSVKAYLTPDSHPKAIVQLSSEKERVSEQNE